MVLLNISVWYEEFGYQNSVVHCEHLILHYS